MRKVVTYYAKDGTPFDNEVDGYTYEREQKKNYKEEIYRCAKQLDQSIWKQFHPDYSEEEDQTDLQGSP